MKFMMLVKHGELRPSAQELMDAMAVLSESGEKRHDAREWRTRPTAQSAAFAFQGEKFP
jgi:hypothetical protein